MVTLSGPSSRTHYLSDSRGLVRLSDMHDAHLANAIAKTERLGPAHAHTVHALRAEQSRRASAARP